MRNRTRMTAALALCLAVAAPGACRKDAAEKAAVPPAAAEESPLATRLNAMEPMAQIDTMRTLVAADTSSAQLRFFAGNAYYSYASGLERSNPGLQAYLDTAAAEYAQAVAIDSTMSKAWVNMGLALADRGKPYEAKNALRQAIKVNPNDVLAYCHLGYVSHVGGDLTEAMRQYQAALAVDPNSPQAHYNLGLAFAEAKIFPEALREWKLVIENDPDGDLGKAARENVKIIEQYMKP